MKSKRCSACGFNFDDEDASGTSEIYDPASAVARAPVLTQASKWSQGFHFEFNNTPGPAFSVISAPSAAAPRASWTPVGTATEVLPGDYEFTDVTSTNAPQRFYRVRSPSAWVGKPPLKNFMPNGQRAPSLTRPG